MGQKTHPNGLRLGVIRSWNSKWFEEKKYAQWLHEDLEIRKLIKTTMKHAGISKVEIERRARQIRISVHTARPGILIGPKGKEADKIKAAIAKIATGEVYLSIHEIRRSETDAQLVAENIATQLERRVAFRRAMRKAMQAAQKFGAKGIRVSCKGRLGGAEMGRYEWYLEGRVPLHTLRADIQYGEALASTTYGIIGVKTWIYHGDIIPERSGANA
ncbi:MAG: 30S ribosomal protein S3 [Myxococcales bacterium]|nr:30S ribosomal protein S3 [Myxococcales bacterium]